MNSFGLDGWDLDLTETNPGIVRFILDRFPVSFPSLLFDHCAHLPTSMFDNDSGSMDEILVKIMWDFGFEADCPGLPTELRRIHAEFLGLRVQGLRRCGREGLSLGMADGPVTGGSDGEISRAHLGDPRQSD